MKKNIFIIALFSLLIFTEGCKDTKEKTDFHPAIENQVERKIDLDFSEMNYTMIASILYNISLNPEIYAGMKVKIKGLFYTTIYEGIRYFSVVIWDSTGCCPTGLDFEPPETMEFPESFPELNETITVTGLFKIQGLGEDKKFIFQADEIIKNDLASPSQEF